MVSVAFASWMSAHGSCDSMNVLISFAAAWTPWPIVKLVVMSISQPRLEPGEDVLRIRLPLGRVTERFVGDLKVVLAEHPGPSPVQLLLVGAEERTIQLPSEFSVDVRGVVGVLRTMLGPDAIAA